MTKNTLSAIYSALTNVDFENKDSVMDALYAEIHKGDAAKAEKDAVYAEAHDIVFSVFSMTDAPVTVNDIMESVGDALPKGFTKNKVTYGLTHYWADEVTKHEGKVNAYTRA